MPNWSTPVAPTPRSGGNAPAPQAGGWRCPNDRPFPIPVFGKETPMTTSVWRTWAQAVPPLARHLELDIPTRPAECAVLLATAGLGEQYAVYERDGVWHVAI